MALPDSYTQKPGSIPAYFDAILNAEAPERFTYRFLEKLEFKSTNDRLFVGILKDLVFLDTDGLPQGVKGTHKHGSEGGRDSNALALPG